jgi:hypothetical protein
MAIKLIPRISYGRYSLGSLSFHPASKLPIYTTQAQLMFQTEFLGEAFGAGGAVHQIREPAVGHHARDDVGYSSLPEVRLFEITFGFAICFERLRSTDTEAGGIRSREKWSTVEKSARTFLSFYVQVVTLMTPYAG